MTTSPPPKLLKARQFHSRIFAILVIGLLAVIAPQLPFDSLSRMMMLWSGYALVIIGAFGRIYCSTFIGGRKNTDVLREGPFSVVRNPLYVFSFIAMVGIGLQSGMWSLTLLLLAAFVLYYPLVVRKEEAYLRHKFGPSYDAYVRDVPRWWPNMALWVEPEISPAMPKFVRRTLYDAAVFFLPMPLYTVIAELQYRAILPVLLTLP